jgi:hypothetical protein
MIDIARSLSSGIEMLTRRPQLCRASVVAVLLTAALSAGCCKTCPDPKPPDAGGTGPDGPRQFNSRTLPKPQGATWAKGDKCKRNDLNPPPPQTSVFTMDENNSVNPQLWLCGP